MDLDCQRGGLPITPETATANSFSHLPLVLNATQLAGVLNISRANAYNLLHREDFPTLHIGQRMLVSRDRLVRWMDEQCRAQ